MSKFEELRHQLESQMLQASSLQTEKESQTFITQRFVYLHKQMSDKAINHADYVKLINRLSVFKQGAFNDYIDMLAGAASMGMLDVILAQGTGDTPFTPDAARKRSDTITDLTGVDPYTPDKEKE